MVRNIRVAIYPNGHAPPHVRAIGRDGARAKFDLNCPAGPVRLVEQADFRAVEIAEVGGAIAANLAVLCDRWGSIHG